MTQVDFHFNVPDKLHYACRLLRKATGRGVSVLVTAPTEVLNQLDVLLWTFSPHDFVPHARSSDPAPVRAASPILLSESIADAPHRQALLNLGDAIPTGFEQFARLIEIVSQDDMQDRQRARGRWKHYASLGIEPTRHDIALKETAE